MRLTAAGILLILLAAGCSGDGSPAPTTSSPATAATTATVATTEPSSGTTAPATPVTTAAPAAFEGAALSSDRNALFAASGACAVCHQQMSDGIEDVSVDATWRSTMMANAARDPYWVATVTAEIAANPDYDAILQDKCSTCHTPMARTSDATAGDSGVLFDAGYLDPANDLHGLATDGVSCTLCHQIEPDNLGTADSFSGGFLIDPDLPEWERLAYGPYVSPPGQATIMQSASGFIPVQGLHMQESELCASCHTLFTPTVDGAGAVVGTFPEQTPYLEWEASDYATTVSCQGCHMPEALGPVQLSITGGPPRTPFSRHHFVGGNTLVLTMFRSFGEEMAVTASSDQFDATLGRVEEQLTDRTASVSFDAIVLDNSRLRIPVVIASEVGHKFPSGYPSRRAWIHLTVRAADGTIVFESGAWTPDGSITGNANDSDPASFEPHYETISDPGEVQIYETVIANTDGEVTTTLLRGAGYLKDNRLLPSGFDKTAATDDTAVYGAASTDGDFTGGGDAIAFVVDPGAASGPFTIDVELLYQAISFRWAANLGTYDTAAVDRFVGYYDALGNAPVVIATAQASTGP